MNRVFFDIYYNFELFKITFDGNFLEILSSISTFLAVIVALFSPICIEWRRREESKKNIRKSLKEEILHNISQLFSNEPKRRMSKEILSNFEKNFSHFIHDSGVYRDIKKTYSEHEIYELERGNSDLKNDLNFSIIAMNYYLELVDYGENKKEYENIKSEQLKKDKSSLVDLKGRSVKKWEEIIEQKINKMIR